MFFGHFSLGLLLAALYPQIDVVLLYIGSAWIDFFNGIFIICGLTITKANPNSGPYLFQDLIYADLDHSLLMAFVWSLLYGIIAATLLYKPMLKYKCDQPISRRAFGFICFLSSFLHWFLDVPVHNADLALYPGSSYHFGWSWWGRFGAMSWAFEVGMTWTFCLAATLIAYSHNEHIKNPYDISRSRVMMYHSAIIGGLLPLIVNPIMSPMKYIAMHPEMQSQIADGLGVALGYLIPIIIMRSVAQYDALHQIKPHIPLTPTSGNGANGAAIDHHIKQQ